MKFNCFVFLIFFVVVDIRPVFGLGQSSTIGFEEGPNRYKLADEASSVRILVDKSDWPGVIRTAKDLAVDFGRVTGRNGTVELVSSSAASAWPNTTAGVIIAGTLGKSKLVDQIVRSHNLSISTVSGKWETFVTQVIHNPLPGIPSAVLLAGSDKRGTIYSLYDISEQIGVSPWYFWADVPPKQHNSIYAITSLPPTIRGPPSVKYRGIFLNDEAPALTRWVDANFPAGKYGSAFNADFYALVFELLLRLRANLLYPAMWDGMFAIDDVRNQPLADEYGVVMGTSHTEPFARSTREWIVLGKGSWDFHSNQNNVVPFLREGARRAKPYETLFTIGMRGSHDTPMSDSIEIGLLESVVETQRQILAQENMTNVPQSWCLYKEVQGYYDAGMKVPEDVTLLWADDNWGNIRRLPSENEMLRKGGAGVYYHFDYVGGPRNYKWINTVILQKTWHQMNLAYARNARTIWVVNVGDLKPLEIPINHFLDMAYDISAWGPNLEEWLKAWSGREFDVSLSEAITSVVKRYSTLVGQCKFELVSPETWSILHYQEAENILSSWKTLAEDAQEVYGKIDSSGKAAFFELVLHPIQAGGNIHSLYIGAAKNNMYARQGRNSANFMAEETLRMFKRDHEISKAYNGLLNTKWNHMMDQTHIGYTYWQQPMRQMTPPLQYVQALETSLSGDMRISVEGQLGVIPGDDQYNKGGVLVLSTSSLYSPPRWIDISNTGITNVTFQAHSDPFVKLSQSRGSLSISGEGSDARVLLMLDWSIVPLNGGSASVTVTGVSDVTGARSIAKVLVPYVTVRPPNGYTGFVEADGYVALDAWNLSSHFFPGPAVVGEPALLRIWDYGVTLSPLTLRSLDTSKAPTLEVPFWTFSNLQSPSIILFFTPSLNTDHDHPMRYAISVDGTDSQVIQLVHDRSAGDMPSGWDQAVSQERWESKTSWVISPGIHKLSIKLLDGGIVLKRVVVNMGGLKPSGLGPPPSKWVSSTQ